MKEYRILIRTSYWVAAVADFIIAILVLIPDRMGVTGFVYPMGLMSAVTGVYFRLANIGYNISRALSASSMVITNGGQN
jgi:hypothetical protein